MMILLESEPEVFGMRSGREFSTERQFLQSWSKDPDKLEDSRVKEVAGTVSTRDSWSLWLFT